MRSSRPGLKHSFWPTFWASGSRHGFPPSPKPRSATRSGSPSTPRISIFSIKAPARACSMPPGAPPTTRAPVRSRRSRSAEELQMAAQSAPRETKRRRHDRKRFQWSAIPLLAPSALLLLVLFLLPVAYSFYLGLTNLQLIGPHSVNYFFTGFWNIHLLLNDPNFWRS